MEIRLMSIDDYPSVYRLWTSTPGMGLRSLDDSREGIAKFLKRNPSTSFVALDGENVAGVILTGNDGRRGYVYHVCVDVPFRGKKIGKALVEKALEALKKEGINKVGLVCFKNNETGNTFWHKMGWTNREDLNYYNISICSDNL